MQKGAKKKYHKVTPPPPSLLVPRPWTALNAQTCRVQNELFLSDVVDDNYLNTVVGLCNVIEPLSLPPPPFPKKAKNVLPTDPNRSHCRKAESEFDS
jgi:hypothetical protein